MKEQTIDDIILQLETLIDKCIIDNNRLGYFAALYHKVTCRVREGILNNEFHDNELMEKLDVCFANRYLEAVEKWNNNEEPTQSWAVAFRASKKGSLLLLHQLLLGINAHINLDLGIASVEVTRPAELKIIQKDFNAINRILSELTAELINKINRISPFLSLLGMHATNDNSVFIQFTLSNARDGAWVSAEELSEKTGTDILEYIQERDKKIEKLATAITHSNFMLRVSIWIIHLFEWKNPAKIIRELQKQEKNYFKVSESAITVGTKSGTSIEPTSQLASTKNVTG